MSASLILMTTMFPCRGSANQEPPSAGREQHSVDGYDDVDKRDDRQDDRDGNAPVSPRILHGDELRIIHEAATCHGDSTAFDAAINCGRECDDTQVRDTRDDKVEEAVPNAAVVREPKGRQAKRAPIPLADVARAWFARWLPGADRPAPWAGH